MNRRHISLLTAALLTGVLQASPDSNIAADLDDLGTITITPDRVSEPLKNSTANVTVITDKEIQERGYQTLADALSRVSGFSLSGNGGPGQSRSLYLRGMKRGNVLIMIDGVPMKDPNDLSFSYPLEHILLDNVSRIEIVKGAQSGLWGSDAVAGVVNIITKSAVPGGHVSLRGGYGSYDTESAGITLSASGEAGSFFLSGDHYRTGGFSALLPRNAEADGYTNNTLDFKGSLNISPDSRLGIFYHKISADFDYDAHNDPNDKSDGTFSNDLMGLDYHYNDGKLSIDALFSVNTYSRQYNDSLWGASTYDGTATRATLNAAYKIDRHQRLSGGVEYNRYEGSSTWNPVEASYDNRAIYGSYRYIWDDLLGARTIFNATLRYDNFSTFDNKATYRFGLKRQCNLLPGLFTAANLYSAYKAPSIYNASRPKPGTTLKPEYTRGYELTIGYKKLLSLTYFHNRITDEIIPAGGWPPVYTNDERSYTISGMEIGSQWSLETLPLTLSANYTHLFDTKDKVGKPLYQRPQNSVNLFLDYDLNPRIHLGADLQYVGKRMGQKWIGWTPVDVKLKSYTLVNLSYNHKIAKNLEFSLHLHNLFDRHYETVEGYSTEGRSIYGKVEYKF